MSFVSLSFVIYIAAVISIYFSVRKEIQWVILLFASYLFVIINSGLLSLVLLFDTTVAYLSGKTIESIEERAKEETGILSKQMPQCEIKAIFSKAKSRQKRALTIGVFVVLGTLTVIKYHNLILGFGFDLKDPGFVFLIPIGISFYTLQAISYMVDIYRKRIKAESNFFHFMLYMSYFPQIVQGPIPRYKQLANQLYEPHEFEYERACFGVQLILWGFMKKMILADRIAIPVSAVFDNYTDYNGMIVLFAAMGYGLQVYADFSAGMDIAAGFSQVIGIELVQNFRQPYFSESVEEFWRRWHITLGSFMREYVFYPLSLSKVFSTIGKFFRGALGADVGKKIPPLLATFIVYFLVGLWHGTEWKYAVYGIWNGVFIALGILLKNQYNTANKIMRVNESAFSWRLFRIIRTYVIVSIGRIISRAPSVSVAAKMIMSMMRDWYYFAFLTDGTLLRLGLKTAEWLLLLVCVFALLFVDYKHEQGISIRRWISKQGPVFRTIVYIAAVVSVVLFGVYGPGYDSAVFIYQQF